MGARLPARHSGEPHIVWIVDWTDREQADFVAAFTEMGVEPCIIRSRPTGATVGTKWHHLYSYPAYLKLAVRAMTSRADVVVAWQPLAAMLLAYVPRRPALIAIEPVIVEHDRRLLGRFTRRAVKRIDRLVMCSEGVAARLIATGLAPEQVVVIRRGVTPVESREGPGDDYLLAGGREHRDWITLREAASGVDLPVRLGAPNAPPEGGSLELLPPLNRMDYVEQLRHARALIVPLKDDTRGAGLLAILEAYSYGVPVIASRNIATVDYVIDGAGVLVEPADVDGLRGAMREMSRPEIATTASAAATALAHSELSLVHFVRRVQELARQLG